MKEYLNDFRVGIRQFLKAPGSMIFAVVAYSIGLGLVTLMLTLIFGVSRATPDYEKVEQIFTMRWDPDTEDLWKNGNQYSAWRLANFEDFEAEQSSFAQMAAIRDAAFNVVLDEVPERVSGYQVTPDFFQALGVRPFMGRYFSNDDPRAEIDQVVVVSYEYWQNDLKANPDIVGKGLNMNGAVYTVIGVAPKGFDFVAEGKIWIPLKREADETRLVGHGYLVVGMLADGVSLDQANAEMNNLALQFEKAYPDSNTGYIRVDLDPLAALYLPPEVRGLFDVMLVCSGLVLLIACANVANILSARMLGRTKELAIRASLGAGRKRLVVQLLLEGLAIAFLGGLGGWGIGEATSRAVWNFVIQSDNVTLPSWMSMEVDLRVMSILFLATLISSILAGILPALRASRADVNEVLKDGSRGSSGLVIGRVSKALVVLQMSFSLGLLIAAGSMVKTVQAAQAYDPPYDTSKMLVARIDLTGPNYDTNDKKWAFYEQLRSKLEQLSGVRSAGFSSSFDFMYNWNSTMRIEGEDYVDKSDMPRLRNEVVSNNYFEALGLPILEGRGFTDFDVGDGTQDGVVVVNEYLAQTFWPGESAIGKRLRDTWNEEGPWLEVVGVVGNTQMLGPGAQPDSKPDGFYQPLGQRTWLSNATVFLYAEGDPLDLVTPFRRIVLDMDPGLSPYRIKTVDTAVKDNQFGLYFFRNIFGMFGIGSLILASVGIYGVMSFSVMQRSMEYGVRRSLGATPRSVIGLVFKRGAWQTGIGVALGVVFGFLLVGVISQGLGVVSGGVSSFATPVVFLLGVSSLALLIPSLRVSRLNLSQTLREG